MKTFTEFTPCEKILNKKSWIRETKNLSTDADSRTNTILERLQDLSAEGGGGGGGGVGGGFEIVSQQQIRQRFAHAESTQYQVFPTNPRSSSSYKRKKSIKIIPSNKCTWCSYTCKNKQSMTKHIERFHKGKPESVHQTTMKRQLTCFFFLNVVLPLDYLWTTLSWLLPQSNPDVKTPFRHSCCRICHTRV